MPTQPPSPKGPVISVDPVPVEVKKLDLSGMSVAQVISGTLSVITAVGTVIVLVIQTGSKARIDELQIQSTKQTKTLEEVHTLTNTNFSEQKAEIEKLRTASNAKEVSAAMELRELRSTIARLEALIAESFRSAATRPK